jgi:hypothetical protein
MGRVRVTVESVRDQVRSSHLEGKCEITTDGGLWLVMKKQFRFLVFTELPLPDTDLCDFRGRPKRLMSCSLPVGDEKKDLTV